MVRAMPNDPNSKVPATPLRLSTHPLGYFESEYSFC